MARRREPLSGVDLGLSIAAYFVSRKLPLPATRDELKAGFLDLRAHPSWQCLGVSLSPWGAILELIGAQFVELDDGPNVFWMTTQIDERKTELESSAFAIGGEPFEGSSESEFGLRREIRALGFMALTGHPSAAISWPFPSNKAANRPHAVDVDMTAVEYFDITNTSDNIITLRDVSTPIMRPQGAFSLTPVTPVCAVGPRSRVRLTISLAPQTLGLHQTAVLFSFEGFEIMRSIQVLVEDEVARASAPVRPYVKRARKRAVLSAVETVPGEAPPMPVTRYQNRLQQFKIPAGVKNAVNSGGELPVLTEELDKDNYWKRTSALLFVEELQMEVDIQMFDMEGVALEQSNSYLALKVPGLAEKRPSVLYGDHVMVHLPGTPRKEFQGCVHAVRLEEVLLKFHPSFHATFIPGLLVNVRFTFNRVPLRREHEAIQESVEIPRGLLFPANTDWTSVDPSLPRSFKPVNKELNEQQLRAVREVLNRSEGGLANGCPYLIHGPPGTGKTNTCIEAILQVLRADPTARVLACTPSNFAADVILERLQPHLQKRELYRLTAPARNVNEVEPSLLTCCTFSKTVGHFTIPDAAALAAPRVVISTCCSASLLHAQGLPRGHFSHVFIDEAGHARETEALIPVALYANDQTVVVLAGDHKQLGPVIRSKLAARGGLEKSYLERLATQPPYLPHGPNSEYHPRFITLLVRNYRSHPAILKLPSEMFYCGQLVPCANEVLRSSLTQWPGLPNRKEFPIVFDGVEGRDEREGNSPSWFNPTEVSRVVKYVTELIEYRGARVTASEIGVISPYRKQVQKISKQMANKYPEVKVGSVEQFQGREKRVIIISTVRSSEQHIESDLQHNLGFLRNPKRFNVAITRAKALLIIVGNPHVLAQDRCWGAMYHYCREKGAYSGCEGPEPAPSPPPSGPPGGWDELLQQWTQLTLADATEDVEKPEWPEAK